MDAQSRKFSSMPTSTSAEGIARADGNLQYGKQKILIVDDDAVTLEILKVYLDNLYEVYPVSSGKLALDFLSTHTVDLVLLDYMMPEMDGPTVFQMIRCQFPSPYIPIVFLTGVSDEELVIKGLQLRPTDYLLKPVKRTVLLDRVHKVLLRE